MICGECFEWAYVTVPEQGRLVHAIVAHPWTKKRFAHAWLEVGGRVYDWQSVVQGLGPGKRGWTRKAFYEAYRPRALRSYTFTEARRQAVRHRHSGPWEASVSDAVIPDE